MGFRRSLREAGARAASAAASATASVRAQASERASQVGAKVAERVSDAISDAVVDQMLPMGGESSRSARAIRIGLEVAQRAQQAMPENSRVRTMASAGYARLPESVRASTNAAAANLAATMTTRVAGDVARKGAQATLNTLSEALFGGWAYPWGEDTQTHTAGTSGDKEHTNAKPTNTITRLRARVGTALQRRRSVAAAATALARQLFGRPASDTKNHSDSSSHDTPWRRAWQRLRQERGRLGSAASRWKATWWPARAPRKSQRWQALSLLLSRFVGQRDTLAALALGVAITATQWNPSGPLFALVAGFVSATLLKLAIIDQREGVLPNELTQRSASITAIGLTLAALPGLHGRSWLRALGMGTALPVGYAAARALSGGGVGFGDIKLAPTIGMLLGYRGAAGAADATALAIISAAFTMAVQRRRNGPNEPAWQLATPERALPFGPHMAAGAIAALLWQGRRLR